MMASCTLLQLALLVEHDVLIKHMLLDEASGKL